MLVSVSSFPSTLVGIERLIVFLALFRKLSVGLRNPFVAAIGVISETVTLGAALDLWNSDIFFFISGVLSVPSGATSAGHISR